MSQILITDLLTDKLRIKLDLNFDNFETRNDYNLWASAILNSETWTDTRQFARLQSVSATQRLFIVSFLHTARLFCELGKLPIFETPDVISLSQSESSNQNFVLEIEVCTVQFIPKAAYEKSIGTALQLCQWMAKSSPTVENKNKIFLTITENLIKPLKQLVPAGASTIPVLKVAHSLNIPFFHLGAGVYQLGWGSKARRMDRSSTDLDSSIGARLSQNKAVTSNLLRLAGLPTGFHLVVDDESKALSAADRIGFPVVVKPTDCDRGEGVSVDVVDNASVKTAFSHAFSRSKSKKVIVERQVSGVCHRLFIANGRLLYAVKRLPMSVKGDGQRTVNELVNDEVSAQKQKAPWDRSKIQPIDEKAIMALASIGFSPTAIPADGMWVPLRRIESTYDGGVDIDVTEIVHSQNTSAAIAAAQLCGLHVAGVDIISPDISQPWHENGAIINEINYAPLFGGGEISRSKIPDFFEKFIEDEGRIPIETFETETAAFARHAEYSQQGSRCYILTPTATIDGSGRVLTMPFNGLRQRLRALVCRSDVDAILMCIDMQG